MSIGQVIAPVLAVAVAAVLVVAVPTVVKASAVNPKTQDLKIRQLASDR